MISSRSNISAECDIMTIVFHITNHLIQRMIPIPESCRKLNTLTDFSTHKLLIYRINGVGIQSDEITVEGCRKTKKTTNIHTITTFI